MKVTKNTHDYTTSTPKVTVFPEEYFSGCDVSIKFEGKPVSEIAGLQFSLQEQMKPVYGYSSRLYDTVAIGNRIVMGSFIMPFSRSDKLKNVLKDSNAQVGKRIPSDIELKKTSQSEIDRYRPSVGSGLLNNNIEHLMYGDFASESKFQSAIIKAALGWLNTPYVLGGNNRNAIDCSSLMDRIYDDAGKKISTPTGSSRNTVRTLMETNRSYKVPRDSIVVGDILVTSENNTWHCGIYIGNGEIIHASYGQKKVVRQKLTDSLRYWGTFVGFYRPHALTEAINKEQGNLSEFYLKTPSGTMVMPYDVSFSNEYSFVRTPRQWRTRYEGRRSEIGAYGDEVTKSSEFPYESYKLLNLRVPTLNYRNLSYMPTDSISKVILHQSYTYPSSIEELHTEALNSGKKGIGCHFYIRKDGTIEQGMPLCMTISEDNSIHIIAEGYFDSDFIADEKQGKAENKGMTQLQFSSLVAIINDIKEQCNSLTMLMGERERRVIYEGKSYEDTTSPGLLFAIEDISNFTGLIRPTNIANEFSNRILSLYGKYTLEEVYGEYGFTMEESGEMVYQMSMTYENDGGGGSISTHPLAKLGNLSMKYESGNTSPRPWFVTPDGTHNGLPMKSYGSYQLHQHWSMPQFLDYLSTANPSFSNRLKSHTRFSVSFDKEWENIGRSFPNEMQDLQHKHIKGKFYDVACNAINGLAQAKELSFKTTSYSAAIQNAIWSIAVRRGPQTCAYIFRDAMNNSRQAFLSKQEAMIIEAIYQQAAVENQNRKDLSEKLRATLHINRCVKERDDCLSIIGKSPTKDVYMTATGMPSYENDGGGAAKSYDIGVYGGKIITNKSPYTTNNSIGRLQMFLNYAGSYGLSVDNTAGPKTNEALRSFQKLLETKYPTLDRNFFNSSGQVDESGWNKLRKLSQTWGDTGSEASSSAESYYNQTAGASPMDLISNIWGLSDVASNNQQPFFYSDDLINLQVLGLDIIINYGYHKDAQIKKLKNLFIRSVGQQIDPSGTAVADVYEFIARDIE